MKQGLLEVIRASGYWRVNIRPSVTPEQPLLLGLCKQVVEKSSVSIRGWDFPHINHRRDDEGGYENGSDFVENWTNWYGFNEFWKMYTSSQFISYVALREDTKREEHGNPQGSVLNTVGTVYQITEICEFCHRLFKNGLYEFGANLHVSLINTKGRNLTAGQNRIPFFERMATNAGRIDLVTGFSPEQLEDQHMRVALDLCVQIFDRFGWNPDRSQPQADQEGFIRRDFRY